MTAAQICLLVLAFIIMVMAVIVCRRIRASLRASSVVEVRELVSTDHIYRSIALTHSGLICVAMFWYAFYAVSLSRPDSGRFLIWSMLAMVLPSVFAGLQFAVMDHGLRHRVRKLVQEEATKRWLYWIITYEASLAAIPCIIFCRGLSLTALTTLVIS